MSVALRFRDHEGFQQAAIQMAVAGGSAGVVAWGLLGPAWTAGSVALVAGCTSVATLAPERWRKPVEVVFRVGLAFLGASCLALAGGAAGAFWFALLFAAALSWGLHGRKLLFALGASAAAAAVALWTQTQVIHASELAALPGWSVAGLAGIAFSLVGTCALLPRHLELRRDEVERAYRDVSGRAAGEVHELVERAHAVWTRAIRELPEEDDSRRLLAEAVMRLFDSARRWSAIDAEGSQNQAAALVDRMKELDERIALATDEVVRSQYESAQAALGQQLRYLEDIGTHRERVLARMHNYLAVMERLRLAVVKLESADASREGLDPIVSDLEALGQDIETSTAALDAADRAAAGAPDLPARRESATLGP